MNKKLLAGLASVVAVSGFWACGDGNINHMTTGDEIIVNLYNTDEDQETFMNEALENCKADDACYIKYQGYFDGTEELPVSSSDVETATSSSSATTPVFNSSSSMTLVVHSSSSITIVDNPSSSAEVSAGTGFGTCAPVPSTSVTKGETVTWTFTGNATPPDGYTRIAWGSALNSATYEWVSEDEGTASGKTFAVQYMTTGKKSVSVKVTVDDKQAFDPLDVFLQKIRLATGLDINHLYGSYSQSLTENQFRMLS